jgi:hypothetical protein
VSFEPPAEALEAINAGTSTITRRVEFYEYDGVTRWYPAGVDDEPVSRLIDGSISVEYSSDERRKGDISLDNTDGFLTPNPNGGFWYDKIIKVYRGCKYPVGVRPPRIVIIESETDAYSSIRSWLVSKGFTDVTVLTSVTSASEVSGYDLVVSYSGTVATAKSALLKSIYDVGGSVLTVSMANNQTHVPLISTGFTGAGQWGFSKPTTDGPFNNEPNWPTPASTMITPTTGFIITAPTTGTIRAVRSGNPGADTVLLGTSSAGGRWAEVHTAAVCLTTDFGLRILSWATDWAVGRHYVTSDTWEIQIAELMIDSIARDDFPHKVNISVRDYTKKMILSKFTKATGFAKGTNISIILSALAANAGCTNQTIGVGDEVLYADLSYSAGTSRWDVVKEICLAFGYEAFFDARGYFVVRPAIDPTFGPISATFSTGAEGNLTSINRSTNDGNLFNHVVVYGMQAEDTTVMPAFGEARNDEPSSPTRIERIGDRMADPIESSLVYNYVQAMQVALRYLKVAALESYNLSFGSINYPWLEAGEIARVIDPDAGPTDPDRYLMTSLTIPLGLGPMSIVGQRVTIVGDTSIPAEVESSSAAGVVGGTARGTVLLGRA